MPLNEQEREVFFRAVDVSTLSAREIAYFKKFGFSPNQAQTECLARMALDRTVLEIYSNVS